MKLDEITKMILSITIVAIVIMAVAIPIFSDATKPATQLNDVRYSGVGTSEAVTLTLTASDTEIIVSDGTGSVALAKPTEGSNCIILADTFFVSVEPGSTSASAFIINTYNTYDTEKIGANVILRFESGETLVSQGSGAGQYLTNSLLVYPSSDGDLGCCAIGDEDGLKPYSYAWVNQGATCYWCQVSGADGSSLIGIGDPWDPTSITVNAWIESSSTAWTGHPSGVTLISDGPVARQFGALTFEDAALSGIADSVVVFAPIEYQPNKASGGSSDQVNTLVNLIPMIMVAGLVTAVAASYVRKRMEE